MLLKSGADTNMAMANGLTPLHIAGESGNLAIMKLLVGKIDLNTFLNTCGEKAVSFQLDNGADPMVVDRVRES